MKRGAERQITKDGPDDDDDEIEEIQDPEGFQKADESALARREIRALPKRVLAASRPPSLNGLPPALALDGEKVEVVPQPKFAGFVGFGVGTSASNPFTFTGQTPPISTSTPYVLDTATKPTPPTSTLNPVLAPPSLAALRSPPSDTDAAPAKPVTSPTEETDAVALQYFKSLRGLNTSFVSAISAAVKKDPFFDVTSLVESYKNLRTTIQSDFDGSLQQVTISGSVATSSTPLFGSKVPPEKTTSFPVPKLPVWSTGVPSRPPPASESGTKTGAFTFSPFTPPSSSTPTPLSSGVTSKLSEPSTSSSTTPPEPPKSAFTFTPSSTSNATSSLPPPSGFSFAAPLSIENATSKPALESFSQETASSSASTSSQLTSTVPSLNPGAVPNLFATAKSTSAFGTSDAAFKPTSIFGSSIFGSSRTTESSKPSPFNPGPSDSKDSSKAIGLFGNPATTPSTSASIFGSSSDKPVGFFGSASPPKGGSFTFGKPGGSIGNPVGFGFGSFTPSAGDTTIPGSSSSGFNFGTLPTKPNERLFSPPTTDKSSESTPQPEADGSEEGGEEEAPKLLPSHSHDGEGEGEEDEETTHIVKCKVYRLSKSDDKSEWKDLGVGMLRLKKHKETNVRRVLMRNSNTGRILVNFRVYGSLRPSLAKTAISFIGYENSTPTSFRIRVKTEEQAGDLKQAMEREIAAVQAAERSLGLC